jgi:hypothetical protein
LWAHVTVTLDVGRGWHLSPRGWQPGVPQLTAVIGDTLSRKVQYITVHWIEACLRIGSRSCLRSAMRGTRRGWRRVPGQAQGGRAAVLLLTALAIQAQPCPSPSLIQTSSKKEASTLLHCHACTRGQCAPLPCLLRPHMLDWDCCTGMKHVHASHRAQGQHVPQACTRYLGQAAGSACSSTRPAACAQESRGPRVPGQVWRCVGCACVEQAAHRRGQAVCSHAHSLLYAPCTLVCAQCRNSRLTYITAPSWSPTRQNMSKIGHGCSRPHARPSILWPHRRHVCVVAPAAPPAQVVTSHAGQVSHRGGHRPQAKHFHSPPPPSWAHPSSPLIFILHPV